MCPETGRLVSCIFALEIDEAINSEKATSALIRVVASLHKGKNGLADINPASVLRAGIIVVVVVEDFLGKFCKVRQWLGMGLKL